DQVAARVAAVGAARRLAQAVDRGADEIRLVAVAAVERGAGHAGLPGDGVHRQPRVADLAQQALRGREDEPVGLGIHLPAGPAASCLSDAHRATVTLDWRNRL